jgi:hypothetical protein
VDGSSVLPAADAEGSTEDGGRFLVDGGGLVRDGASASADAKLDASRGADAGIVVTLKRGGCSCELGGRDFGNPSLPSVSVFLLGVLTWLARGFGKRHRQ